MLVQSDTNIFLQLHKKKTTTYTSPPKLADNPPKKNDEGSNKYTSAN